MHLMAKTDYAPPFAEQLPDGSTVAYGPTPSTHARHLAEFRQWAWRPGMSRESKAEGADELRAFMRPGGHHLRTDVTKRQLEVYVLVFEHGHSIRWTAKHLEMHRSTVKTHIQRIKNKASK